MGGKDKGSKKGEKKTDANKLTPVDRTFYELTIADLNQKLSRLRSHFQALDETNTNLNEKLLELEEDRVDVLAHLERKLAEGQDKICELEERLIEVTKVRDRENVESQEKIRELEVRYKAMHDQLQSEIKLLNGKLNSLDEFRVQRDVLLSKFDDQEAELKEKDRSHKETLYDLEQKAIVERDELKKEVEQKLIQVAEDFTRASEIRNAGYTKRLIRENIALQKELDATMRLYFEMKRKFDENEMHWKELHARQTTNDSIKEQLIRDGKEKTQIIEQLTKRYEMLEKRFIEAQSYREKYERLVTRETCERFREIDAAAQKRSLKQRIERLEGERDALRLLATMQSKELQRLNAVMEQIKCTIEAAVVGATATATATELPTAKISIKVIKPHSRENLLAVLIEIISRGITGKLTDPPQIQSLSAAEMQSPQLTSIIYEPGKMGFMTTTSRSRHRSSKTLVELFKREVRFLRHSAEICKSGSVQAQLLRDNKIIPAGNAFDPKSFFDAEYGGMLYFSLSHDEDVVVDNDSNKVEMMPAEINDEKEEMGNDTKKILKPIEENQFEEESGDFDINLFY